MAKTPLKLEKERCGLTTEQIAAAVGVKQPTISRIENGVRRPSPELANRIATFFKNAITRDQVLFPEEYAAAAPAARKSRKAA